MTDHTTERDTELSEEVADDRWEALVARLSDQSVRKHYDAFVDVPWDEHPVDPADPRWELTPGLDPLAGTDWYQAQPPEVRSRIGLHSVVSKAKTGLEFESILMRGLLGFATTLPNGAPEYRYVLHEVIEEGQHSLMFQELVNRSGIDVPGLGWRERLAAPVIISWGKWFPELFLMFVLGGEDPIDHVQRKSLRGGNPHPLLEVIMRNHVTEEARHLSFARHYLKRRVPELGRLKRAVLAVATPRILTEMSKMMLRPSRQIVGAYGIPRPVLREAYTKNPEARAEKARAVRKVRMLCREIGLMNPLAERLWKAGGIWEADEA